MENKAIIPSKIHLTNIKVIAENTILVDKKVGVIPSYDIQIAHNMMHNLEKELIKIRLFLDISGQLNEKSIN